MREYPVSELVDIRLMRWRDLRQELTPQSNKFIDVNVNPIHPTRLVWVSRFYTGEDKLSVTAYDAETGYHLFTKYQPVTRKQR